MTNRIVYYDYLRIAATVGVVVVHVSAQYWSSVELGSHEWNVLNTYDSLVRWVVPVFVLLSGALFLDPDRKVEIPKLYKKNILRLFVALVFWSAIYALNGYLQGNTLEKTVENFIAGHYHLWFLFMMIGLYIITPLLRKITESRDATKYFLAVSLVLTFLIPRALDFAMLAGNHYVVTVAQALDRAYANSSFHLTLGYSCYFVCGYYLSKFEIAPRARYLIYGLGILGFAATIFLTDAFSLRASEATQHFYNYFATNVMIEAVAVFVFAKYELSRIRVSDVVADKLSYLSKICFGVYLVHVLVLEKFRTVLGFDAMTFDPLVGVILLTAATVLVSGLISAVLNKIPVLSRYIV